ncbi:MAG: helix-turn-helix transcriptional regulator [Acholeplasmatales bacterium]|nr:helix-turn-helix transcriptional regulator [Acholeplasmatales bacterium]
MTYKEFAKIIKQKRIDSEYTQKEFAIMIPIRQTTYNKIENGNQEPTFIQLQAICKLLDIDLTEILELKKPNPEHQALYD